MTVRTSEITGIPAVQSDDMELIRRVSAEEESAFDTLYRRYYPRVTRFLLRVTRRPDLVNEIFNDTMLVVWQKAVTFNEKSQVSTWIIGIAYHKAIKRMKSLEKEKRQVSLEDDKILDNLDAIDMDETQPCHRLVETSQLAAHIQRMMAELSPAHRAVIELTYYQGFSYDEIAELSGCPVNTVKTRMFHARAKLRSLLMDSA